MRGGGEVQAALSLKKLQAELAQVGWPHAGGGLCACMVAVHVGRQVGSTQQAPSLPLLTHRPLAGQWGAQEVWAHQQEGAGPVRELHGAAGRAVPPKGGAWWGARGATQKMAVGVAGAAEAAAAASAFASIRGWPWWPLHPPTPAPTAHPPRRPAHTHTTGERPRRRQDPAADRHAGHAQG